MKVLVIPTWYPNGADKLMGIYHKEFTEALNNHGILANMLFIDRQRLSKPFKYLFMKKNEVIKESNYQVYIKRMLNYTPINFDLQMKLYTKKMNKAFKEYIKIHGKPDVIHAHVTVPAGVCACMIGKKFHIPVVVTEHCGDLERFFNKEPFKKYSGFVLNNSIYSCVSSYMKDIAYKYHKDVYVLPNTVNIDIFANKVKRKVKDEFRFVIACALRDGKKIDIALQALKILKNENMNVHLDIIGTGFLEDYYKKICHDLELDDIVTFMGQKSKKEMADIFKGEHALIISSELESFAIPGIEALASGMPVVSTDCLGPRMFINKDTGLLCKVNDKKDLARSMKFLIEHYNEYDPSYIKDFAKKFGEDEVVKTATHLYELAINKVSDN